MEQFIGIIYDTLMIEFKEKLYPELCSFLKKRRELIHKTCAYECAIFQFLDIAIFRGVLGNPEHELYNHVHIIRGIVFL